MAELLVLIAVCLVTWMAFDLIAGDEPGCSGSCEQGRKACDCRNK